MTPSPEVAILRLLAQVTHADAPAIGAACHMAPGEVHSRLASLESLRLVASRQNTDSRPPQRVYSVTAEGQRKAGVSDARTRGA